MSRLSLIVALAGALGVAQSVHAGALVSISFPDGVGLSQSTTQAGPRTATAPFDMGGIGHIVNPSFAMPGSGINAPDFVLHQTVGVVDLADVVVTFEFAQPVIIDAFDVVQHHNGVRAFEVLIGNDLMSMTSIGTDSMPENRVEYFEHRFEYDTDQAARFVQLRVSEPELAGQGGWAFYRAFPVLVPAPGALGGLLVGAGLLGATRRRG